MSIDKMIDLISRTESISIPDAQAVITKLRAAEELAEAVETLNSITDDLGRMQQKQIVLGNHVRAYRKAGGSDE